MLTSPQCVEVVRIRPLPGMRDELIALRGRFSTEFREATPGFHSHQWFELDDGSFLDIALWSAASDLDAVDEDQPILEEWYGLVEIISMETGDVRHD